mmetsp:Transcript_12601/g.25209  ORF Transcript_12601/g.25209 Transcript_12601/m.25209 type:complete len:252 (-) Transcript_12601:122-877(-)
MMGVSCSPVPHILGNKVSRSGNVRTECRPIRQSRIRQSHCLSQQHPTPPQHRAESGPDGNLRDTVVSTHHSEDRHRRRTPDQQHANRPAKHRRIDDGRPRHGRKKSYQRVRGGHARIRNGRTIGAPLVEDFFQRFGEVDGTDRSDDHVRPDERAGPGPDRDCVGESHEPFRGGIEGVHDRGDPCGQPGRGDVRRRGADDGVGRKDSSPPQRRRPTEGAGRSRGEAGPTDRRRYEGTVRTGCGGETEEGHDG